MYAPNASASETPDAPADPRHAKGLIVRLALLVLIVGAAFGVAAGTATAAGTVASTTHLTASRTTAVTGQSITFHAHIYGKTGLPAPTGTVTFKAGSTVLGTATVSTSSTGVTQATLAHAFTVGTYSITAAYSGDATYAASNSNAVAITVVKGNTTVSMKATQSTLHPGHWTISASVLPVSPAHGTRTGTVTFVVDGGTPVTVTLSNNAAHISVVLAAGNHTATGKYSGDANFNGSSGSVSFTQ